MKKSFYLLIALGIFLLATFFRLYGTNWDQSQHLHPDERFLTMVTQAIAWPKDISEYLDTQSSPLNPHNKGFGFFVYGTFPIFFTRFITDLLHKTDYENITLIGRQLSALFDLGTVVLVFLIGKQLVASSKHQVTSKNKIHATYYMLHAMPFLAAFFYTAAVLPIQLSHFFAVDTYLTFFITLTFYFLTRLIINPLPSTPNSIFLGVSLGLAAASKVTAVFTVPIIGIGLFCWVLKYKNVKRFIIFCGLFSLSFYFTFRLAQPYLFANPNLLDPQLNAKVLDNWKQLESFNDKTGGFPPGVQWITTKPYLFPLKNMIFWGLGLPLGILSVFSVTYYVLGVLKDVIYSLKNKKYVIPNTIYVIQLLLLFWILLLFFYQGNQFVKALRYFYPVYPFLAILSAHFISKCVFYIAKKYKSTRIYLFVYLFIGLLVIIYPISFVSIYSRPHSRVTASEWIYKNIPTGAVRSSEVWDDGLPLSLPSPGKIHEKYPVVEFPLYWPDNKEKWNLMIENLHTVDYIFETSNRLYGSIMTFPQKYPITYRYYQSLFDGTLGFEKVAEITSRPNLQIPFIKWCINLPGERYGIVAKPNQSCDESGISLVDDYADETFTVYDHPKVVIFKKVKSVDYPKVLELPW